MKGLGCPLNLVICCVCSLGGSPSIISSTVTGLVVEVLNVFITDIASDRATSRLLVEGHQPVHRTRRFRSRRGRKAQILQFGCTSWQVELPDLYPLSRQLNQD